MLGLGSLNLEDALAGEIEGVFDSKPHLESYTAVHADPRVFVAAKAKLAKPKTKREAAALRDVDDADEIRTEMEKSGAKLRKSGDPD